MTAPMKGLMLISQNILSQKQGGIWLLFNQVNPIEFKNIFSEGGQQHMKLIVTKNKTQNLLDDKSNMKLFHWNWLRGTVMTSFGLD